VSNAHKVGRRASTTKPDLWYYDQLPPTARAALANADHAWSSGWIFNRWKRGERGYKTGKDCAAAIARADKTTRPK
jgi:hypothetical protein